MTLISKNNCFQKPEKKKRKKRKNGGKQVVNQQSRFSKSNFIQTVQLLGKLWEQQKLQLYLCMLSEELME